MENAIAHLVLHAWERRDRQRHEATLDDILNGSPTETEARTLARVREEFREVSDLVDAYAHGGSIEASNGQILCDAYRLQSRLKEKEERLYQYAESAVEAYEARGEARREAAGAAIEALAAYDPSRAARLETRREVVDERLGIPAHDELQERYRNAEHALRSAHAQPLARGARKELRRLRDEFLDIANLADGPLRDRANDALRVASTKYGQSVSSYRKRFYLRAMGAVAAVTALGLFTFATVRHYAITGEHPLTPVTALFEQESPPTLPGGKRFLYEDTKRGVAILYEERERRPLEQGKLYKQPSVLATP